MKDGAKREPNKAIRCSGLQPQYFPRLHYFNRILNADVFIVRDEVQFVRDHKFPDGHRGPSFQAHTPIKTNEGTHLLSVPTKHEGLKPINQTTISFDERWPQKHLKTIFYAYQKSASFNTIYPAVEALITAGYKSLADLNVATICWAIATLAGLDKGTELTLSEVNKFLSTQTMFRLQRIVLASQSQFYKKQPNASANEKIIGLYTEVGATEDYSGGTAVAAYMDIDLFRRHGLEVVVQNWQCPEYPQQFHKTGFIPNLSIMDLLMNVPVDKARSIIID